MTIELLPKHSLNFGENLEYVSTYILADTYAEAKRSREIEKIRILTKGSKTGKERILYLEKYENFAGRDRYMIAFIDCDRINHVTPNHIENEAVNEIGDGVEHTERFHYWKKGNNPKYVEIMFSAWVNSDPLIHNGDMTHSFLSKQTNYKGGYRFNNKVF